MYRRNTGCQKNQAKKKETLSILCLKYILSTNEVAYYVVIFALEDKCAASVKAVGGCKEGKRETPYFVIECLFLFRNQFSFEPPKD